MDSDSLMLTGYQQYHLNLTKANGMYDIVCWHFWPSICSNLEMYQNSSKEKPQFELSYSTFDEYELNDLSPQSWADLVERYHYIKANNNYNPSIHQVLECDISMVYSVALFCSDCIYFAWICAWTIFCRFHHFPYLVDKYHYNVHGRSSASDKQCNQECQKTTLCSVSNIVSTNYFKCVSSS